jgi:hypothetical protein
MFSDRLAWHELLVNKSATQIAGFERDAKQL